jgi:CHAD domain-containing protein
MKNTEIEFKFDSGELTKQEFFNRLSTEFYIEKSGDKNILDIYYDTKEQILNQIGVSIRRRIEGKKETVEIKFEPKEQAEFFKRTEWVLYRGGLKENLDTDTIKDKIFSAFGLKLEKTLIPIIELTAFKEKYLLKHNLTVCELSFDTVNAATAIRRKGGKTPFVFSEAELELKKGALPVFNEIGKRIEKSLNLKIISISKKHRALRHFNSDSAFIPPPSLSQNDPSYQTAIKTCVYYFECALLQEKGARLDIDPEYIHDFRVNLRRLRTVISDFKDAISRYDYLKIQKELRWITSFLGEVRDIDVYAVNFHSLLPPDTDTSIIKRINSVLEKIKKERLQTLITYFESPRYKQNLPILKRYFYGDMIKKQDSTPSALFARKLIRKKLKSVIKNCRNILKRWEKIRDEEIHALRIRIKKLRYTADYTMSLIDITAKAFINELKTLQDIIGGYVDTIFYINLTDKISGLLPNSAKILSALETLDKTYFAIEKLRMERRGKIKETLEKFINHPETKSFISKIENN